MPNISLQMIQPTAPLHWTSILHYIVLVGMLYILVTSGDKTPLIFIFILGAAALTVGFSLYCDRIQSARIFVFLARVIMTGIPITLAGISPTDNTRNTAIIVAVCAAPILAITFLTCLLGAPLGDPRIAWWCG